MILSGKEIEKRMGKDIIIDPFDSKNVNPNSYNLSLHNELVVYRSHNIDMKRDNITDELIIPDEGLLLTPNKLYLGRTVEHTETNGLVPLLEGRSSTGRLGLFTHITAGFGDVGFKGYWTLEISCIQPIRIYPFISVCQIYYHTIEGEYRSYSNGKYQNNRSIQSSMLYKEFKS